MQDQWSEVQTTKNSLNYESTFKGHPNDDLRPNYIVVKETTQFCGWQTFLYFAILYFLALSIFYMFISFSKHEPIGCQLTCSPNLMQCQCQLNQAIWTNPTNVELSWSAPALKKDAVFGQSIKGVLLEQNSISHVVTVDPEPEQSCFPTECQVFIGVTDQLISQNSIFIIIFQGNFPFNNDAVIKGHFYESNSSHPQLSTKNQLIVTLVFAILVGVYAMLRKSVAFDVGIRSSRNHKKKQLKNQEQYEEIPSQVEEMNNNLKQKYAEALNAYLKANEKKTLSEIENSNSDDEMSLDQ